MWTLFPNVENYYSFHYILDEANQQDKIALELRGDDQSGSPLERKNWFGIEGNNYLDTTHVKGFKIEVAMDSQGAQGSLISGAFELQDLQAVEEYNPERVDVSQCIVESDLLFRADRSATFTRIEFLNFEECCDSCTADARCNFAFSDGRDCYKTEQLYADSIALIAPEATGSLVTFVKQQSDQNFCTVCECRNSDFTIDCQGRNLVTLPHNFDPNPNESGIPGPPAWLPRVLDLRGNAGILFVGSQALSELSTLEELHLPSSIVHLSPTALRGLAQLQTVTFEQDDDTALPQINNVVPDQSSAFSDICCSRGDSLDLSSSSSSPNQATSLTFCNLQSDRPGIDAMYQDFIQYLGATVLDALTPSSPFMSEAAEDKYKCAEFCNIRSDCNYFSYDSRLPNTEHICLLLENSGTPTEICCAAEHYQDADQTIAGWVSGRVPRTRHVDDNAQVVLDQTMLVADQTTSFQTTFAVSLSVPCPSEVPYGSNLA